MPSGGGAFKKACSSSKKLKNTLSFIHAIKPSPAQTVGLMILYTFFTLVYLFLFATFFTFYAENIKSFSTHIVHL